MQLHVGCDYPRKPLWALPHNVQLVQVLSNIAGIAYNNLKKKNIHYSSPNSLSASSYHATATLEFKCHPISQALHKENFEQKTLSIPAAVIPIPCDDIVEAIAVWCPAWYCRNNRRGLCLLEISCQRQNNCNLFRNWFWTRMGVLCFLWNASMFNIWFDLVVFH